MPVLSSNNQNLLLAIARKVISSVILSEAKNLESGSFASLRMTVGNDPELLQKSGCFVTLYTKPKTLRGCIGTFESDEPLFRAVMKTAVSAAFKDPRFPPLVAGELDRIRIEISVLGKLQKMNSIADLKIGKHGILIQLKNKSGTYLPEVAEEQGWTSEEFVHHCAVEKAGLKPEELVVAELYLYEVEKIEEKEI